MNGCKVYASVVYIINKHEHVFRLRIVTRYDYFEYDPLNF